MTRKCPYCRQPMAELPLQRSQRGMPPILVEACVPCETIWFDRGESGMISPAAISTLVGTFGASDARNPLHERPECPVCDKRLSVTSDMTRHGPIVYRSCPVCSGRATSLSHFLVEKGFVRHLPPAAVRAVGASIGTIRCQSCGAPVDLRSQDRCGFCKSPVAVLDPGAVSKALGEMTRRQGDIDAPPSSAALALAIVDNAMASSASAISSGGPRARAVLSSKYDPDAVDDLISQSMSLLLGTRR